MNKVILAVAVLVLLVLAYAGRNNTLKQTTKPVCQITEIKYVSCK